MKADVRETLPAKGSFYNIIYSLCQEKETANILYDDNGITRANGYIKHLGEQNKSPYLVLDNGVQININSIIAVNGMFADDYSEC
jgi:hypothetical protein